MKLITNYERPRLDRFVKVVNVGLDDLCFSYFGRFSAACFLIEVQTFEKSRADPFFLKTPDYSFNSDYNQKSEIQHLKLMVRTCIIL